MAKAPSLPNVSGQYLSTTQINTAFEAIEEAFENTLSRDGSTPNQMEADLDMNSNDILNVRGIQADSFIVDGENFSDLLQRAVNEVQAAVALAEMVTFTRVTLTYKGDGTNNPLVLPLSLSDARYIDVFVNETRKYPNIDYTVSGYNLIPTEHWTVSDEDNILVLINKPYNDTAPTTDDITYEGTTLTTILRRLFQTNTFYLIDYLHPSDLAFAEVGNTASQNETRVTAAVQSFHDAALGWMMGSNNRHVTLVYPNVVLAINDEMFSETWAELLWTTGGARSNCRIVFQFNGVRVQTKNWVARAAARTSGLYKALGIAYPVPKVVFRYEASAPGNPRIETQGRIYIFGSDNPNTDPIGLKFKSINVSQFDCFFFQGLRNTAFYHENIFNSTFYSWQVNSCGYQPTEYGGNGFMSDTVRFQNAGRVITATEPVFDASHAGRRFMLNGAAAADSDVFQVHSGVIESVDSPTQITLTAATTPFRNVTSPAVASFEAIKATTTAGSNVVILSAPITDNLAGRYVTLFGCGQDDIAVNGQYYGAMTVVVTAHSGDQITLAHPARLSRANIPISFGTSMVITRGAENAAIVGSVVERTDDCTYHDTRIENGSSPFDGASMMALIQHCSSTAFVGGSKFHGVSARARNNFGANFANLGFDYATGIVMPESILTHGGYSASAGKIIMTGGLTDITMECDEVAYPDATETATILCDPTQNQIGITLRLGNARTDGRVGNAVKARYGAYGNAGMIVAANSAVRPQRGLGIPDWPTDLHDVLVTGDTLATGWGSTRSRAVSWLSTGGWVPKDGTVYTVGGLQYIGQTGATAISDMPGLVYAATPDLPAAVSGTANAITLITGAGLSGTIPLDLEVRFRATAANSGAVTIALDGGSPQPTITTTGVALGAGYIRTGVPTRARWNGTAWVVGREYDSGTYTVTIKDTAGNTSPTTVTGRWRMVDADEVQVDFDTLSGINATGLTSGDVARIGLPFASAETKLGLIALTSMPTVTVTGTTTYASFMPRVVTGDSFCTIRSFAPMGNQNGQTVANMTGANINNFSIRYRITR